MFLFSPHTDDQAKRYWNSIFLICSLEDIQCDSDVHIIVNKTIYPSKLMCANYANNGNVLLKIQRVYHIRFLRKCATSNRRQKIRLSPEPDRDRPLPQGKLRKRHHESGSTAVRTHRIHLHRTEGTTWHRGMIYHKEEHEREEGSFWSYFWPFKCPQKYTTHWPTKTINANTKGFGLMIRISWLLWGGASW